MRSTTAPESPRLHMPKEGANPAQHQHHPPGGEHQMVPRPKVTLTQYRGSGTLAGKVLYPNSGEVVNG